FSGTPIIVLDGTNAGSGAAGLQIGAGGAGSTLRGLVVDHFGLAGIYLNGAGSNTITGNYIGTDAAGTTALGNGVGVLSWGAANNVLGGTTAAAGNLISGNLQNGVAIVGAGATGNLVEGNSIGTDATGTLALGNAFAGVGIIGASGNTIGGTAAG